MREYIITDKQFKTATEAYLEHELSRPITDVFISGDKLPEIVRCRDCKHYYEAENYHPNGNYVMRCCKYFDAYNDEVEPDGFCAWSERRDA